MVRRARAGERLRTLDDVDRELHPEDLLITCGPDGERILALAGVMGGEDGEVTPGRTTDVLVESAHFDARTVARTSRRTGCRARRPSASSAGSTLPSPRRPRSWPSTCWSSTAAAPPTRRSPTATSG